MSTLVGEPVVAMSATAGIVGCPGAVAAVGVGAKEAPVGGDTVIEPFRQEGDIAAPVSYSHLTLPTTPYV